jgi:hypothetical protein
MKFGRSFPKSEELKPIRARKLFSFADKTDGLNFVRLDVGPADDPLVWLDNVDRSFSDGLECHRAYEELVSSGKARFKIIHYRNGKCSELNIAEVPRSEVFVQPMSDDRYLIASCRAQPSLLNAWIFDAGGALVNQFRLGDHIEAMRATLSGHIWTGYGDEGAFGSDPVGRNLIACFNQDGTLLFPDHYMEEFSDWCSGLNIESENCIWILPNYGTLVKVENFAVTRVCKGYSQGSGIFAVSGNYACWAPAILPPFWSALAAAGQALPLAWFDIDFFVISNLESGEVEFYRAVDESGNLIYPESYAARGSKMYFTIKHDVYVFDLKNVLV